MRSRVFPITQSSSWLITPATLQRLAGLGESMNPTISGTKGGEGGRSRPGAWEIRRTACVLVMEDRCLAAMETVFPKNRIVFPLCGPAHCINHFLLTNGVLGTGNPVHLRESWNIYSIWGFKLFILNREQFCKILAITNETPKSFPLETC